MHRDDEEAIHGLHEGFVRAWARGDAEACAACYADDAVRVGAFGDVQRGRSAIRGAYASLFGGRMAGAAIELAPGTLRSLGEGLALWQAEIRLTPLGRPPLRGHVVELLRKEAAGWRIVEGHPKFFPAAG